MSAATMVSTIRTVTPSRRPPRILLRSSWQVVNIGDIAHTPGVLALLEKYLPEAEVRLWAASSTPAIEAMEHRRFPNLSICGGSFNADGQPSTPELAEALEWTDFLLHGSGPSLVVAGDLEAFEKLTGKPYGVYGITHGLPTKRSPPSAFDQVPRDKAILDRARFVYLRDPVSLAFARSQGVQSPVVEFGPDGAFACDVRDDAAAEAFLFVHGLETGQFLCCIPKLRFTPYWLIRNSPKDESRHSRNEEMKVADHAPLLESIIAVVRETKLKVLLCPEDQTQMAVGKELLFDKLPDDVKPRVVWRDNFWLTNEALSTYVRSAGLFGHEQHSAIMCIGAGIPAIVCRWEEQSSKGEMWRTIGLGDWLFNMDLEAERQAVAPAVLAMAQDPAAARAKAAQACAVVERYQRETMAVVAQNLGPTPKA